MPRRRTIRTLGVLFATALAVALPAHASAEPAPPADGSALFVPDSTTPSDAEYTPAPTPVHTPAPTLMPVNISGTTGKTIVKVTKIPVNSSLNLRAQANLNSEVIMRLYYGQALVVLEQYEDGWLLVETDVIKGYVREEYVNFD